MVEIQLGDEDGFHYQEGEMGEFYSRFEWDQVITSLSLAIAS